MSENHFNRDTLARRYAERHIKTDPGIQMIYYLPAGTREREIRFVEVNDQIAELGSQQLEALDFGINVDESEGLSLKVLDITPSQWEKINKKELKLPNGWSLEGAVPFSR